LEKEIIFADVLSDTSFTQYIENADRKAEYAAPVRDSKTETISKHFNIPIETILADAFTQVLEDYAKQELGRNTSLYQVESDRDYYRQRGETKQQSIFYHVFFPQTPIK